MRKRIKGERICSSLPNGSVVDMSARELNKLVEWGMKAVELSRGGNVRAQRGLHLGRICENAGHPVLALRVWIDTLSMVSCDNWDWADVPLNWHVYTFDSKVASEAQEELARNVDRLYRKLGHADQAHFLHDAKEDYRSLWLWKYDEPFWDR